MSTRDDLEAALHARYDNDTLTVYADYLQVVGDPRGELIALDLRGGRETTHRRGQLTVGVPGRLAENARRSQLLRAWLGEDVAVTFDDGQQLWYAGDLTGAHATFECGFLDVVMTDDVDEPLSPDILGGACGAYVRRLSVRGPTARIESSLEVLVARERPWLQHLALARPPHETSALDPALLRRLVAVTPNLEVLDVTGRNLLDRFVHPQVRELGITGCEAIDLVHGLPLPALHTLDFAFDGGRFTPRGLFSAERLPALRRLCFARETSPHHLYVELGTLGVAAQLTHLVLPSIGTRAELGLVQAAIDRMPLLREIAFARDYVCFEQRAAELRHAWARVRLPEAWPWPPRERFDDLVLAIEGFSVDPVDLVDGLEDCYDELPEDQRAIWSRFFHTLSSLDRAQFHEQAFAARDLERALSVFDDANLRELGRDLRHHLERRGDFFATIQWVP